MARHTQYNDIPSEAQDQILAHLGRDGGPLLAADRRLRDRTAVPFRRRLDKLLSYAVLQGSSIFVGDEDAVKRALFHRSRDHGGSIPTVAPTRDQCYTIQFRMGEFTVVDGSEAYERRMSWGWSDAEGTQRLPAQDVLNMFCARWTPATVLLVSTWSGVGLNIFYRGPAYKPDIPLNLLA